MNLIDRDKLLDDLINRLPKMAAITEAALPVLICEQPVIKAAPITREQVEKMRGEWKIESDTLGTLISCSECDRGFYVTDKYEYQRCIHQQFCELCGAPHDRRGRGYSLETIGGDAGCG